MYCTNCGKEIPDAALFCRYCGAKVEDEEGEWSDISYPKQPIYNNNSTRKSYNSKNGKAGKNILLVLLVLALMACSVAGTTAYLKGQSKATGTTYEGKGFDSPEEAVQAYAEAFAKKDIYEMYSCCAIESYVDHYDYEAELERLKSYQSNYFGGPMMTSDDKATRQMDIEERKAQLITQINRGFIRASLPYDSPVLLGLTLSVGEDGDYAATDIVKMLRGAGAIKSIKVKEVLPGTHWMKDEPSNYATIIEASEKVFGGEIESLGVKLDVDGVDWILFLDTIKYDDNWYCLRVHGIAASYYGVDSQSGGLIHEEDLKQ